MFVICHLYEDSLLSQQSVERVCLTPSENLGIILHTLAPAQFHEITTVIVSDTHNEEYPRSIEERQTIGRTALYFIEKGR